MIICSNTIYSKAFVKKFNFKKIPVINKLNFVLYMLTINITKYLILKYMIKGF